MNLRVELMWINKYACLIHTKRIAAKKKVKRRRKTNRIEMVLPVLRKCEICLVVNLKWRLWIGANVNGNYSTLWRNLQMISTSSTWISQILSELDCWLLKKSVTIALFFSSFYLDFNIFNELVVFLLLSFFMTSKKPK